MTEKTTVLFVDDDPNILSGLRRFMRSRNADIQAFFCQSGEDGLTQMESQPMDVVVSDMRMPGMDGAQFLSHVRTRYPGTIRVILSGYADSECVMRTVGPAHLYLAKPCPPEALIQAIARPLALRRLLTSEGMRAALAGLTNLPSPSQLFFKLEAELQSAKCSTATVADIISQDVAMTAELLKLTNSAYFSTMSKATTPLQAVRTLGMETIEALVLRIGIFRQLDYASGIGPMMEALNAYGLRIATLAEQIASAEGADAATSKAAYCAGMLSSVGCLILLDGHSAKYREALSQVTATLPLHQLEQQIFGASHALVGAYLLGLWGFADSVVEAVAYACSPSACPGTDNLVLTAVHAARALGPAFPGLAEGIGPQPGLDMSYICNARKDLRLKHWQSLSLGANHEHAHA